MNYVLQLSLEGDAAVNAQLDKLAANVEKVSSGKMSVGDILHKAELAQIDKQIDESGIMTGEHLGKAVSKGMGKSLNKVMTPIMKEWVQTIAKGSGDVSKLWGNAVKVGAAGIPKPEQHGPSAEEFARFSQIQGPDLSGKLFAKMQKELAALPMQGPDLSGDLRRKHWKHVGLEEPTGKDLAKVQALPDINALFSQINLDFKKIFTGLALGFSNPYIGSRLLSDELGKLNGGKGSGIVGGLFGKGGVGGFAEIFLSFKAFKLAVDVFRKGAEVIYAASERAAKLYSSALQSGLGLGFSAKRGTLASIMGVSEQDVFRFGAQMAYLNPRIEQATSILAKTAVPLTQLDWNWKILGLDMSALVSKISADLAPAISNFIIGLDELVKALTRTWGITKAIAEIANPALLLIPLIQRKYEDADPKNFPSPQAWTKQLPASHLEHMGLQIGGGSNNYARDTAKNTRQLVVLMTKIASGAGKGIKSDVGPWGFSNTTAQP